MQLVALMCQYRPRASVLMIDVQMEDHEIGRKRVVIITGVRAGPEH